MALDRFPTDMIEDRKTGKNLVDILEDIVAIPQQDTPPEDAQEGDLWIDTSDNEYQGTVFDEINQQLLTKTAITRQNTPPADAKQGDLWLDTSEDEYQGTVFDKMNQQLSSKAVIARQATAPADARPGDVWIDTSDNEYQGTVFADLSAQLAGKAQQTDLNNIATYKEINAALPFGTNLTALKGNGEDETSALLALLNYVADNHLTLYIPRSMTVYINTMTVSNKSNFGIRGEGTIKRLSNSATIGALLKLDTCSNVSIPEINFDGNGLNNGCVENVAYTSSQEQKHTVILSACTNITISNMYVLNPCGDGIYLTGSSKDITIGTIKGKADKQIGRNIVSIINAQDIRIGEIYGDNWGHYDMPGGFDIEPNLSTDVVRNVSVNNINITGGGANPVSCLFGVGVATVENVFLDSVNVTRTNVVAPGAGGVSSVLLCTNNIHVGKVSIKNKTAYQIAGLTIQNYAGSPKGIYVYDAYIEGCYRGLLVGYSAAKVEDVYVKAIIRNNQFDGVCIGSCKNVFLNVDIDYVADANRYFLNKPSGNSVADTVTITGNFAKRSTPNTICMISGDVTTNMVNWLIKDVDFTGWNPGNMLYGSGWGGSVRKINCNNFNYRSAVPTDGGTYNQGDYVENTAHTELGTAGSKYIIKGWRCVAGGTPGTWVQERVLTGN